MSIEQEYKWAASHPGDFGRFKKVPALEGFKKQFSKVSIVDSYFDSADGVLRAEKLALRLRSADNQYQITLKSASKIKNGLAQRQEQTIDLPQAKSHTRALSILRAIFHKGWPGLKGPKQLFIIKNKREICLIENAAFKAEICFDNCNITAGDKNIKFYEIEMEFKEGSTEEFKKLAAAVTAQSGLAYSAKSKVATAAGLI